MLAEKLNQPDSQPRIDLEKQHRLWAQASNHQSAVIKLRLMEILKIIFTSSTA